MSLTSRMAVCIVLSSAFLGCSDDAATPATPPATDSGTTADTSPSDTGTPTDSAPADTGTPPGDTGSDTPAADTKIHVRVAHLSPDAPAVDVCVKPKSGSAFVGPALKGALPAGLAFSKVTGYLDLAPGEYTARLVAPGAANCDTSLAGLPDYNLPNLAAGTWATVAAVGEVTATPATFTVLPFVDSHDAPASGKITIRFIHASPTAPAVDVGLGEGAAFAKVWNNVSFKSVGTATGADANGFLTTNPLSAAAVVVRPTGTTTDALVVKPVNAPAGAIVSAFAIGLLSGSGDKRLSALLCVDSAPASGGLANCARVP